MRWGAAWVLPWLWALVPLAGLLFFLVARRERRLRLLLDDEAAAHLALGHRRARAKHTLWFVACALAILALARPQWGIRWQEARRRGLDVLVVLDTSNSMRATDLKPSRLERAKQGISDLLGKLDGDRIGLLAFAGSSFLACPLTTDYAAFTMMLEDVRPGSIPRGGTAIAQALDAALASFEEGGEADRAIVLITDGEDHEGGLDRAIAALAAKRVRVFAIGVGTIGGELIPAAGEAGGPFLRDRAGSVVRTTLREKTLERIALATGGLYVSSVADGFGWDRVFALGIATLRRDEREARMVKVHEERFPWFLGAAFLTLCVESLLGERRRTKNGLALLALGAIAAFPAAAAADARRALDEGLALFAARSYEQAAGKFEEAAAQAGNEGLDVAAARYNRAAALLLAGKSLQAATLFAEASRSPEPALREKAHYNRGVALATAADAAERGGDAPAAVALLDEALGAYESAMRLDPGDEDPKVNHELVSRKKSRLEERLPKRERSEERRDRTGQAPPERTADRGQAAPAPPQGRTAKEMTPDEARTLLDAMKRREAAQRDRVQPLPARSSPVEKDW